MPQKITVVVPPLEKELAYLAPDLLCAQLTIGSAVYLPLGKRFGYGYVVALESTYQGEVREISGVVGKTPHFLPDQLKFYRWIADYYGYPLSQVLEVAIPKYVASRKREIATLKRIELQDLKLGSKQAAIIDCLNKQSSKSLPVLSLLSQSLSNRASLRSLQKKGIVQLSHEILKFDELTYDQNCGLMPPKVLNAEQEQVFCQLKNNHGYSVSLLHGVTGSGKTEVYIALAEDGLKNGKGALILVPEIALTPQIEQRFKERLGERIAILHSAVGERARWEAWEKLASGKVQIALGARSAIFAPIKDLSLIVVDEEHDSSFKQSDSLRYNARDLAVVRAKFQSAQVILGSATPSLESYKNAKSGRYKLLSLHGKHGSAGKSPIEVIDLSQIKPWFMKSRSISPRLYDALSETLANREQSFVLYNRRGFATFMQCDRCSKVVECPHCSVSLTYHLKSRSLICHYCGHREFVAKHCRHCERPEERSDQLKEALLVERGSGTEKVFEELTKLFPDARIDRLDRDVAQNVTQMDLILSRVRNGETDILVGTQMIAKGHDLPNVTLSAVVDCDVGLNLPDFRASERALQLLIQIAGRAGRASKTGRVILQTRQSQHQAINYAAASQFHEFALSELRNRKALLYPPYSRLIRFIASHQQAEKAEQLLTNLREKIEHRIKLNPARDMLLGPAACPIQRIKSLWRMHLILKTESGETVTKALNIGREERSSKVKLVIDRDPYEML